MDLYVGASWHAVRVSCFACALCECFRPAQKHQGKAISGISENSWSPRCITCKRWAIHEELSDQRGILDQFSLPLQALWG